MSCKKAHPDAQTVTESFLNSHPEYCLAPFGNEVDKSETQNVPITFVSALGKLANGFFRERPLNKKVEITA